MYKSYMTLDNMDTFLYQRVPYIRAVTDAGIEVDVPVNKSTLENLLARDFVLSVRIPLAFGNEVFITIHED